MENNVQFCVTKQSVMVSCCSPHQVVNFISDIASEALDSTPKNNLEFQVNGKEPMLGHMAPKRGYKHACG
jgi:hypothetical protein